MKLPCGMPEETSHLAELMPSMMTSCAWLSRNEQSSCAHVGLCSIDGVWKARGGVRLYQNVLMKSSAWYHIAPSLFSMDLTKSVTVGTNWDSQERVVWNCAKHHKNFPCFSRCFRWWVLSSCGPQIIHRHRIHLVYEGVSFLWLFEFVYTDSEVAPSFSVFESWNMVAAIN